MQPAGGAEEEAGRKEEEGPDPDWWDYEEDPLYGRVAVLRSERRAPSFGREDPVPGRSEAPAVSEGSVVRGRGRAGERGPVAGSKDSDDSWMKFLLSGSELLSVFESVRNVAFCIFSEEKCPDTGRHHFQGYTRLSCGQSLLAFKKSLIAACPLLDSIHIEVSGGSEESNIAYCSKLASHIAGPWTLGETVKVGKRSDLKLALSVVKSGGGVVDVFDSGVASYQAIRLSELYLKFCERPRLPSDPLEVRWYYGSTGSGKTRSAIEEFPKAWVSAGDLRWWDGYDAHKEIVIDDFRKRYCPFDYLLRILDRYPVRVETKGGSRQLRAEVIVITCPWAPDVLYNNRQSDSVGQLLRRIHVQRLFGTVVPPPDDVPSLLDGNGARAAHFRR